MTEPGARASSKAVLPEPLDGGSTPSGDIPAWANEIGVLAAGRDQPFNKGWRFYRGAGDDLESPTINDSCWRVVDLPHDWSIEDVPGGTVGPFDENAVGTSASGFTVGGEGWYRRHFDVQDIPADAHVEIVFDGAYLETDVWLNGRHVGCHMSGYTNFACDLTPHIFRDRTNILAVRVRNMGRNSRWYSGSGIYREVTINVSPRASRIARLGVSAWTRAIHGAKAEIVVNTRLVASADTDRLITRLIAEDGRIVAETAAPASTQLEQLLTLEDAKLWSPEKPTLYLLETELSQDGVAVDTLRQHIGIRIIDFDPALGMTINGVSTSLRGGCVHHDNGLLGACAFREADERRIRLLKARGFNAIRSAHNAASRSLREACDRVGMFLIEEAFDVWEQSKEPQDFSVCFKETWREVLEAWVRAAQNSPSVIMWSIGNEIPERNSAIGVEWQWRLANAVHELDATRPVTAGLNGVLGAPLRASEASARSGRAGEVDNESTVFLDVLGFNYRLGEIEAEHTVHPNRIVYASETFASQAWDYEELRKRAPYFLGEFLWTAMDYLGEAGIGLAEPRMPGARPSFMSAPYPWVNAYCGDLDLIGNQKAASRYRDVIWGLSALEIAVQRPVPEGHFEYVSHWGWSDELQSWTWPDVLGATLVVRVYTSGDRVEVLVNGKLVDTRHLNDDDKMRAEFDVRYVPGVLEVVSYRNGAEIARSRLVTVSAPAKLRLRSEEPAGTAEDELRYVMVEVCDALGRIVPDDRRRVGLSVGGPATLIGFGSANPQAVGSFQARDAETFDGRALIILRKEVPEATVQLEVTALNLQSSSLTLTW